MIEIKYNNIDYEVKNAGLWGTAYGKGISDFNEAKLFFGTLISDKHPVNYISMDGNGINLKDDSLRFYREGDYVGYISSDVSDSDCNIVSSFEFYKGTTDPYWSKGITINFFQDYCTKILVYSYANGYLVDDHYEYPNSLTHHIEAYGTSVYVVFQKTHLPHQFVKIANIVIGDVVVFDKIRDINLHEEIHPLSDDLPINKLETTVISENPINIGNGSKIRVFNNNVYFGTFFIDKIERTNKNIYQLSAVDFVGVLDNRSFMGLGSTNEQLTALVARLVEGTGITINSDEDLAEYHIFGHIPIKSCRYALCAFAWACGFMVNDSRSDLIVLRKIPNHVSSIISNSSKRIIGDSVFKRNDIITSVSVIYPNNVSFEDYSIQVPNEGDKGYDYFFNEPPIDIVTISGNHLQPYGTYNYISFQAENSNVTLSGYKVIFHQTQYTVINPSITASSKENKKEYKEFSIIGFKAPGGAPQNIYRTGDILAMMQSRGTVKAKIILQEERVGDLVTIETAFDGMITGIITSMDIKFGYNNIADIEVIEWQNG